MFIAPASQAYQVSGAVLEVTESKIVVEKNQERWEIARDKETKGDKNIKKGDRVTIQYILRANEVKHSDRGTSTSRTASPLATPIERDAVISDDFKGKADVIEALVTVVRSKGYRCDSVTRVGVSLFSRAIHLGCNQFRYRYDVEDKGGNWTVTVK